MPAVWATIENRTACEGLAFSLEVADACKIM